MQRREFIGLLGGAVVWPLAARAQSQQRVRLIGVLAGTTENDPQAQRRIVAFTQALRQLGWNEGTNIKLEKRYSSGYPERLPALANELVQENCALIVAEAAQAVDAARGATRTIPIVMVYVGDALGPGYVASLAHPGGNITGQTLVATDQALDSNLRAAVDDGAQAIITMEDPMVESNRARITAFALTNRLPVMGEFKPMAEAGGLMSYGPNQVAMWERSAFYVDKILKGADPANLPVEQPAKFELTVNLKTARALGVEFPQTLLSLADVVLE
jgi:ABC-type uncharacterized transport system substrate-binding protein